jgi:Translation initiation factor eIF3 subunit
VDIDSLNPKSQKEFEDYGRILSAKYITHHHKSKFYKELLKALVKSFMGPLDVQQTKDLEACLAGIRADKMKEEQAAKQKAKGMPGSRNFDKIFEVMHLDKTLSHFIPSI